MGRGSRAVPLDWESAHFSSPTRGHNGPSWHRMRKCSFSSPTRGHNWPFRCLDFFIEIWFFDTQSTFYVIVNGLKNAFRGTSLLQMIIQSGRPLANDHTVARWKLPFSRVKSVSWRICSLSGVKHTTKKDHEKLTLMWGGGRGVKTFSQPDRKISRRNLYYMKNYKSKKRWRSLNTVDFCPGDVDIWGSGS